MVEVHHDTPWRLHWPEDRGDDFIMGKWLLANSCRYTSFTVVETSMMHVIEFHRGYLGVSPPPFEWSRWLLKKIELIPDPLSFLSFVTRWLLSLS
jgi:hypothetical protein